MNDFRIMLGYATIYGRDLSKELIKCNNVSFCYNASEFFCYEEMDGQIVNFNEGLGHAASYEKVFELEKMPALSKELLEKMLPYESMAIKLAMRRTNIPIVNYEEAKKDYHKHLRFWNYILEKYAINVVFFECTPHAAHTYIIYALAMIKKIHIISCAVSSIPTRRPYGTTIEGEGNPIKEYYELICKEMKVEDCILEGETKAFYEKYNQPIDKIKNERKKCKHEKTSSNDVRKIFYGSHMGLKGRLKPLKRRMQMIKYLLKKERDLDWYKKYKGEINELKKESCDIQSYNRYVAISQKKYNKIAVEPDYSKKYIYFGLQLTPEESTIPRAGVFSEQYTSIQLLARAAEKVGVSVYVKEHFVQPFRSRLVYKELQEISNVSLIKTTVSSFDLINNSIAVATQTGTCILESALRGKPALVFGEGALWKGLPTMFEIVNEEQGADIIRNILKGFSVEPDEVKKYFYAIQKKTIGCYIQDDWRNQRETKEHKESLKEMLELIQKFLKDYTKY